MHARTHAHMYNTGRCDERELAELCPVTCRACTTCPASTPCGACIADDIGCDAAQHDASKCRIAAAGQTVNVCCAVVKDDNNNEDTDNDNKKYDDDKDAAI